MIVKEYYQNINTKAPKNYFERWYADMWRKHINAPIAQPGVVNRLMTEELAKAGATFNNKDNNYRFVVTFDNDDDYLMFVLKWS